MVSVSTDISEAVSSPPTRPPLKAHLADRRREVLVLACASAIYFFAYFQRVAIPGTIFDELQSTFGVSASDIANLAAIYLYLYGGLQLFAGMLNDRIGALRVLLLGGLLLSLGSVAFALAPTLPGLYAARALVGIGASLIYLSLVKALDTLFHASYFPQLLSLVMVCGSAGGLAGTWPFERLVSLWDWRPVLLGAGLLCMLAWVGTALAGRGLRTAGGEVTSVWATFRGVIGNRRMWPMLVAHPLNFAVYFLLQATLGKKFLLDYAGLSSATAAGFTFLMMLLSIAAILVGGVLPRALHERRKPILLGAISCTLLGTLVLVLGVVWHWGGDWLLAGYLLLALSNLASPIANVLVREHNPSGVIGTAVGLINGACYVGVALLTSAAGLLLDHYRAAAVVTADAVRYPAEAYLTIFLLCLALILTALISALFVGETRGRQVAE
jgi:MFS family permease